MDNKAKLFSLTWGQSSRATQSKIETHMNYNQCKNDYKPKEPTITYDKSQR
jgi:hypothetical protein